MDFFNFVTANEMLKEKQPIENEGSGTEPQHENEGEKADVKPPVAEDEPVAVSEKADHENPSGSEEESEEESDEETDSGGYTSESESSGSHTDHSDKEVSCFSDIISRPLNLYKTVIQGMMRTSLPYACPPPFSGVT